MVLRASPHIMVGFGTAAAAATIGMTGLTLILNNVVILACVYQTPIKHERQS
jgi:hypothetical protein